MIKKIETRGCLRWVTDRENARAQARPRSMSKRTRPHDAATPVAWKGSTTEVDSVKKAKTLIQCAMVRDDLLLNFWYRLVYGLSSNLVETSFLALADNRTYSIPYFFFSYLK